MAIYYQKNFQEYFEKTVPIDSASFLEPFASRVPRGSVVWDIGCGSGRDLKWLRENGFQPTGLEFSSGLADLAALHSGCRVVVGDFEVFDFSTESSDAMLLTAALVHIKPDAVELVLKKILSGLKRGGIIYISMKQGDDVAEDDTGRRFYLWQPEVLEPIFRRVGLEILEYSINQSLLGTKETWLGYLMQLI